MGIGLDVNTQEFRRKIVIICGMINKALAWEDEKQKCFCTMGVSSFAAVLPWEWDESQLSSSSSQ
ncbi:hypothetical protein H5410_019804 [Solanum commersonii]|uniref:Uncharacterized protein n=1 Tax=Solanum commersonii TaxID=4109 RepID=A0A9J5Z693_SOLCO|nr:hypothetical protein H5410_019804 [Solanum commersonii]